MNRASLCNAVSGQVQSVEASLVEENWGVNFVPLSQKFRVNLTGEGESAGRLTPLSEVARGKSASTPGVNLGEVASAPVLDEDDQDSIRRASHLHASPSKPQVKSEPRWQTRCEGPPPPAAQNFLEEVQTDLRGFHILESDKELDEGPVFERDEEWEASIFLWKRPQGSQREVGSVFAGTPGPAFQGDNRRYFVEDTGKQLRIKRLGKRDKQGPKRAEREHKRELERRWLEEKYGLTLPESKGVKNIVNRIGGWKVVGQGWVERRRDTEIAKIAKSVGMERAIEKEMRGRGSPEGGLTENGVEEGLVTNEADGSDGVWVRISKEDIRGDDRAETASEEGLPSRVRTSDPQEEEVWQNELRGYRERLRTSDPGTNGTRQGEKFAASESYAMDKRRVVWAETSGQNVGAGIANAKTRAGQNDPRGFEPQENREGNNAREDPRKEGRAESGELRRVYRKGPAFERLQNEGSAEEVERFARRAFLEHLETKYGKLHVGRLWKESKIEDTRGWLQVYHDTWLPGHGVVALEPFPESAPVLQDPPPPKYKRPYPVTAKMTRRLRALPKALTRRPPPNDPLGSVYVRGRSVELGSVDRFSARGGDEERSLFASRGWLNEEQERRIRERSEELQGGRALSGGGARSGRGKKGDKQLDKPPRVSEPARLGLKVLEWRYARLRRLKKLKKRSDREGGWFEKRVSVAAQSRISLVVDRREEAEREPNSDAGEWELEAVDAVGLIVRQGGLAGREAFASEGNGALSGETADDAANGEDQSGWKADNPAIGRGRSDGPTAAAQDPFRGRPLNGFANSSAILTRAAPPADVIVEAATSDAHLPRSFEGSDERSTHADVTPAGATSTGAPKVETAPGDEMESFGDHEGSAKGVESPMSVSVNTREFLTRTFRVLALRVPEQEAAELAARLEGHLLHWPRIANTWPVPTAATAPPFDAESSDVQFGDDSKLDSPDVQMAESATTPGPQQLSSREKREAALRRLASEPAQKRTQLRTPEPSVRNSVQKEVNKGVGLTVVREISTNDADVNADVSSAGASSLGLSETLRPLLSRSDTGLSDPDATWTTTGVPSGGSARLLLLNEGLAGGGISYLPKIVRLVVGACPSEGGLKAVKGAVLVACDLTLGYEYWTVDEAIGYLVSSGEAKVHVEYVGHLAILYGGGEDLERKQMIGQVLVDKHPHVRTVLAHPSRLSDRPALVAGATSFFTTALENGVRLEMDLGAVRYDVSMAAERQRLLDTFTAADVVCDATAGIGAFAVAAAGRVRFVHACDFNPAALCYLARNAELNGTERNMRLWQLEPEDFIREIHSASPRCYVTHFVLDLRGRSCRVLEAFRGSFNRGLWGERPLPQVHIYTIPRTDDPEAEITEQIYDALGVRSWGVRFYHAQLRTSGGLFTVASFRLPSECAFDDILGYH
ncbi:hypothetical protein KFL_001530200 [Klebsormidium nitens]|uniref:SAM-dependent methyltransferase TRM5/TYW2-type domain-containing protein n=1 Tax=Klebsormidium nitens TaxID=105231 RepID=A0A1Y1HY30_KLENI|nr:hypothetical protein KFL_001530200 [Klebsormidium nitens]|eukprot:GAQ83580.1 hypothetical protein KFL_001530200 [Klebsormidium nitens]